jgi:hypothetical protein
MGSVARGAGDECERAKPDPLPYTLAMERLGLRPEETLVFEDSPSGAAAGVASGAPALARPAWCTRAHAHAHAHTRTRTQARIHSVAVCSLSVCLDRPHARVRVGRSCPWSSATAMVQRASVHNISSCPWSSWLSPLSTVSPLVRGQAGSLLPPLSFLLSVVKLALSSLHCLPPCPWSSWLSPLSTISPLVRGQGCNGRGNGRGCNGRGNGGRGRDRGRAVEPEPGGAAPGRLPAADT